jgi:hypothetical protein
MDTYRLAMKMRAKANANHNIQNIEEIWSNATIEIKTNLVMTECLMHQLNCSRHQAYQQLSNNKKKLDRLLDKYQPQELEKIWNNFFQSQRHQIHVAFTLKKFLLTNSAQTYPNVIAQTISWFQQKSIPPIFIEELRLYHLQEILNNWVNWEKAKQQLQGPLESLKLVLAHYQHPFPENFFHSATYDPNNPEFTVNQFPHIRLLHEAALLWQQIANQDMFEGLQENKTLSTRRLEQNYLAILFKDWKKQQALDQLFSKKTLGNDTQAIYFNGLAFKHAEGKSFLELLHHPQLEKNPLYKSFNTHERIEVLKKKFDQIGESTQYRIGSLQHSLASTLKRIHYYQHSELSKPFQDVKTLFLAFKQMETQWQHKKNYPIHPRILLALHLAESNNAIVSGNAWQNKVKELLHYLDNKIKHDREAKLILEDPTSETKEQSSWLDELENWSFTVPIIGPLLTVEKGIRHKNLNEIISGTVFLGLDACTLLYEESETIGEIAFSSAKLLKNLLFRERITVDNARFTFKTLKVNADDLFLEDSNLLHNHSPLDLERSIAIPQHAHDLATRVRSGEQGLKWHDYDLVYLHNQDRVVPIKPQGGSFREIDWQTGEINARKQLIFKDKTSEHYFSTAGLRGGAPILEFTEEELKQRFTVEQVNAVFELVTSFTIRNFNDLFASYFLIEQQADVSRFDALEFYHSLYKNSLTFRGIFNFFVDFTSFRDIQNWKILIRNNTQTRTDFTKGTIYIASDAEIANLYYMGTQGIAHSKPEQVYLHEILHALTEAEDPKKITAIAHRGPIVYLTDKILSDVGYVFPQQLMYRRPVSNNKDSFNELELSIRKVRGLVAQENSYLDKQLNKLAPITSQKIFGEALADRYTVKELQSILPSSLSITLLELNFIELYDQSFSANDEATHTKLKQFYLHFYQLNVIFNKLYNQWAAARLKNKDSSRWRFVVDDKVTSLAELPSHKKAHCINDLTHRIHIFNDGTLYLSDRGLIPVERTRQLMHEIVQLLTGLKELPADLALTNRGAVVQLTDKILEETNFNLPKRLVSRTTLADDFVTQAHLKGNWIEAQRAMQLEEQFIKETPELNNSCFPWCKRQGRSIAEHHTEPLANQTTTELLEKNNTRRVKRNIQTLEKNPNEIVKNLTPAIEPLSPSTSAHADRIQHQKCSVQSNKKNLPSFDKAWEQSEVYLTHYEQRQAKQYAIREVKSKPGSITANPLKNRQKQGHCKFKSILDKKHSTQPNKAASHLFKSAITKPLLTQPHDLPNKQFKHDNKHNKMLLAPKVSQAINIPILFQRKETKLSDKQRGITAAVTPKLISEKNTRFHHQNTSNPGISRVTATSDTISSLFLVDTIVRVWTRNPHRPIPPSPHMDKQAERQIQSIMERKAFNNSAFR